MNLIVKHKLITGLFAAAFAFTFGGFVWLIAALDARMPQGGAAAGRFILHFNDVDGITRLGSVWDLALVGIFAGIVVALNFVVALELDSRDRVMGKIVAAITLTTAILLFIACAAILSVN